MGSGRAEWAVGELVAGQWRGTVRLVGRAALVRMVVATEWLVVAWAQEPAGMAAGGLAIMAEPAVGNDRGRAGGGQPAVERRECGGDGDAPAQPGLHGGRWG